jgi:hypothetical protein
MFPFRWGEAFAARCLYMESDVLANASPLLDEKIITQAFRVDGKMRAWQNHF